MIGPNHHALQDSGKCQRERESSGSCREISFAPTNACLRPFRRSLEGSKTSPALSAVTA